MRDTPARRMRAQELLSGGAPERYVLSGVESPELIAEVDRLWSRLETDPELRQDAEEVFCAARSRCWPLVALIDAAVR